jgi:hypothetical protein
MANQKNGSAKAETEARQKPVHECRLGRIVGSVWANFTDSGVRHNTVITRLYKDGDDWKRSSSFGRDDLPLVAKVADLAQLWIYQQGQNQDGANDEVPY